MQYISGSALSSSLRVQILYFSFKLYVQSHGQSTTCPQSLLDKHNDTFRKVACSIKCKSFLNCVQLVLFSMQEEHFQGKEQSQHEDYCHQK